MSTVINAYFHDIRNSKPLSREEEISLARDIQNGNQLALNKLVGANLKFVVSVARKYQGRGLELEDLVAEGNIGLIEAAKRFDPDAGYRFISYGVHWIRQAILAAISTDKLIRLPMNQVGSLNIVLKFVNDFKAKEGRNPSEREISKGTGIALSDIRAIQLATKHMSSIDTPIGDDEDSTLESIIEDTGAKASDYTVENESLAKNVEVILNTVLSDKESKVLRLSFGIDCESEDDERIGKIFGVSSERIRQIRAKAILSLKKNPEVLDILREYL